MWVGVDADSGMALQNKKVRARGRAGWQGRGDRAAQGCQKGRKGHGEGQLAGRREGERCQRKYVSSELGSEFQKLYFAGHGCDIYFTLFIRKVSLHKALTRG